MITEIKKLKKLGANVQEIIGGLKLLGEWDVKFDEFHNPFIEIKGVLYTSNAIQHPDFLKNVNTLGKFHTSYSVQHPDFLKNVNTLGKFYTSNPIQHPDFLKNLNIIK